MNKEIATITTAVIINPLWLVAKGLLCTSLFCSGAFDYISLLITLEGEHSINYFCIICL
jgi:hypothetical protein